MPALGAARRRLLARQGQTVTLIRGEDAWTGKGTLTRYRADELVGTLRQGDARVEVHAADFPDAPRDPDELQADGISYTVQYANAVHDGGTLIGWSLVVRGG
jgi:hypothetical protein